MSNVNEKTLLASYRLANKRSENSKVYLFYNTIQRRIGDMATYIRDQVIKKIKEVEVESTFVSLQFDESTDIADCAQFVAFARFESNEKLMDEISFVN